MATLLGGCSVGVAAWDPKEPFRQTTFFTMEPYKTPSAAAKSAVRTPTMGWAARRPPGTVAPQPSLASSLGKSSADSSQVRRQDRRLRQLALRPLGPRRLRQLQNADRRARWRRRVALRSCCPEASQAAPQLARPPPAQRPPAVVRVSRPIFFRRVGCLLPDRSLCLLLRQPAQP